MSQQQILPIHTPCKQCVFAEYTENTQVNCRLNYIDKYRKNNIEIIEAYDDDKEFFIINGKKCIGYRENKWFEKRDMADASIQDKVSKYKESNYAHYIVVINLKNLSLLKLENICKNIHKCNIKPQKIVLIRYLDDEKNFHYNNIEEIFASTNIDYPWRIQTMLDDKLPYEYILYEITKNNKNCRFILSVEDDVDILNALINNANNRVYDELDNFYACGTENKKIVLYSSTVYRYAFEVGKDIINDPELYVVL
jgi:hypothetical protein